MAKIERKTQKIFAGNGANDDIAAFGSMRTGQPVYIDDIEELQTTAYTQGWGKAIAANEAPFLEEMNGVQYGFSKQLAYLLQNGVPEWDDGTTYYATTSFCQVNGVIYQSLTDDNIGNNPTTDTTNWQVYFDKSNVPTLNGDNDFTGANNFTGTLEYNGSEVITKVDATNLNNTITNCILAAPNGVASYDGANVTVKQGLQVLIPNGRNANNTLNSTAYQVNEDITATLTGACKYLLLSSAGEVTLFNGDYFITDTAPTATSLTLYYSPSDNKYYLSDDTGANFSEYQGILLGTCIGADSAVTSLTPYQPTDLLKRNDFAELSGLGMPSGRYTDLTLGASGATYTAPANGWAALLQRSSTSTSSSSLSYVYMSRGVRTGFVTHFTNIDMDIFIPVKAGESFVVNYANINTSYSEAAFKFLYAEGTPSA